MQRAPIAGVDEVGRGPWAGPVLACALVLHADVPGLADSKTLSRARREALFDLLRDRSSASFAIGAASAREIDRFNIRQASLLAMRRAVLRLALRPARVLVDGRDCPDLDLEVEGIVGGDGRVAEIAAASIVAKCCRDALMRRLALRYPAYGWERNVGYGTAAHRLAIATAGVSVHHRQSFKPVRAHLP